MPPLSQQYLDYKTPALAAGAFPLKGDWKLPGDKYTYGDLSMLCRDNGLQPVEVAPPKTRTFAALRKSRMTAAAAYRTPGDKDWLAMRAWQYMLAISGIETGFQEGRNSAPKLVEFAKAPDGSNRVRFVEFDCQQWEVPHWDFTPTVETLIPGVIVD